MKMLQGKLALVTGGNSGIGLAAAKMFAANGARVAISGRNPTTLNAARQELGDGHIAIESDTADLNAIDQLVAKLGKEFGALDILFANAGISDGVRADSATEADYDRIFGVNVKGLFFTIQKSLTLLRPGSSVIITGSIAPRVGRPDHTLYAASKAAVRTFARNMSTEFIPRGIRVNVVSPGPIETSIWERQGSAPDTLARVKEQVAAAVPLGRLGTANEVAAAVLFLASDASSFMLGAEITVDGGVTELRPTSFVPPAESAR